jgi:biopolymer transport protein ExbB
MHTEAVLALWREQSPVMWSLHVLAVLSLAAVLDRCFYWMAARPKRGAGDRLRLATAGGHRPPVLASANTAKAKDYLGLVTRAAQRNPGCSAAPRQAAREQLQRMNQHLGLLDLAVVIAPMLGILGTVSGIAQAFGSARAGGLPEPAALGAGVGLALRSTIWGLSISVFAASSRSLFRGMAEKALAEIQNLLELIEYEQDAAPKGQTDGGRPDGQPAASPAGRPGSAA